MVTPALEPMCRERWVMSARVVGTTESGRRQAPVSAHPAYALTKSCARESTSRRFSSTCNHGAVFPRLEGIEDRVSGDPTAELYALPLRPSHACAYAQRLPLGRKAYGSRCRPPQRGTPRSSAAPGAPAVQSRPLSCGVNERGQRVVWRPHLVEVEKTHDRGFPAPRSQFASEPDRRGP